MELEQRRMAVKSKITSHSRRRFTLPAMWIAPLAFGVTVWAATASGQEQPRPPRRPAGPPPEAPVANWPHKQIDAEAQTAKPKPVPPEIGNALKSGTIADQQAFDEFLNAKFAEFTWSVFDSRLVDLRKNFRNQLLKPATGAARDRVVQQTLRRMREMAEDKEYSNAVRSNAVLLIGELNERDPAPGQTGNPTALPAALPVLLEFIKVDKARDGIEDALTLNALIGVSRHVGLGVTDVDARRRIGAALLAAVHGGQRPGRRSIAAHAALRARAAVVLAELGNPPGDNGGAEAFDALMRMVADHEAPVWMRYYGAKAIGGLSLQGVKDANFTLAAQLLGDLVVQTLEKLDTHREKKACVALLMEAFDGRPTRTAEAEAARGLVTAAPTEQAEYVVELHRRVKEMLARIDKRLSAELNDDQRADEQRKLNRDLVEMIDGLKTWLEENPVENRVLLPGTAEFTPEKDLAQTP